MKFQFCSSENGLIINKKDSLIRGHISQNQYFIIAELKLDTSKILKGVEYEY